LAFALGVTFAFFAGFFAVWTSRGLLQDALLRGLLRRQRLAFGLALGVTSRSSRFFRFLELPVAFCEALFFLVAMELAV